MPVVNFPEVDEAQDFSPLPKGEYLCSIASIDADKYVGRKYLYNRAVLEEWTRGETQNQGRARNRRASRKMAVPLSVAGTPSREGLDRFGGYRTKPIGSSANEGRPHATAAAQAAGADRGHSVQ